VSVELCDDTSDDTSDNYCHHKGHVTLRHLAFICNGCVSASSVMTLEILTATIKDMATLRCLAFICNGCVSANSVMTLQIITATIKDMWDIEASSVYL
jgi:hypothetical protein